MFTMSHFSGGNPLLIIKLRDFCNFINIFGV
jgi:hypothetical protein